MSALYHNLMPPQVIWLAGMQEIANGGSPSSVQGIGGREGSMGKDGTGESSMSDLNNDLSKAPNQAPNPETAGVRPDGVIGDYLTGLVKWFSAEKVYGFISMTDGSTDVFVHANQLRLSGINRRLYPGERVKFKRNTGHKGPFAVDIILLDGNKLPENAN